MSKPQIGHVACVLVLPSVNDVLSGRLHLGNQAAARDPELLAELKITHILELRGDDDTGSKKNEQQQHQATTGEVNNNNCSCSYLQQDASVAVQQQRASGGRG